MEGRFGTTVTAGLCAGVLVLALAGCTPDGQTPAAVQDSPAGPAVLSVAVYGPPPVIAAYTRIASDFTATHPEIVVNVIPYASHDAALAADRRARSAGHPPNLFLMDRSDLPALQAADAIQPVDALLGARRVDFGDGFARDAVESFGADAALQCMPTQLSPMVIYYNTALVDLTKAQDPGGSPITATTGWSMTEFARAARQASRHGHKGVYIAPELGQIAPFLWSGGGQVVDSATQPTALTLSDGATETAMQTLLELVRNPRVTYTQTALAKRSALQRFKSGQLAMILGFRDLTPLLRTQEGLSFDVLPMPRLGSKATIGQLSGVCMSKLASDPTQTADFLAYLVSEAAMDVLARTGYVMPTNLAVTSSDAFLQPGQAPAAGSVFTDQVRNIEELPSGAVWEGVNTLVSHALEGLFYDPVIDPLPERLAAIDAEVAPMLAPPTPSPSPATGGSSPTGSPTS